MNQTESTSEVYVVLKNGMLEEVYSQREDAEEHINELVEIAESEGNYEMDKFESWSGKVTYKKNNAGRAIDQKYQLIPTEVK